MQRAVNSVFHEWVAILGASNVITSQEALKSAETATFATAQQVPVILRPATREEVQESLRIANRFNIPVYPVSSGKNWGYGSRVPAAGACALLDLGRMGRILDFDEQLAYVTVEPGVTQKQLYEYLKTRKSKLWMDATGSSPDCSLIGNTVERGFGHTPYGDHFAHVCGLEIVLPNGEVVETGFSRFAGAKAGDSYRWGVGPSIDGLFSQSNLGIVTRMTIWLMPAPAHFQAFYFSCNRDEDLAAVVEALRPLRLNGTLRSSAHIANDYKVLSSLQQYPWEETGGQTPLEPSAMAAFRKKGSFGCWSGSGALYGTRRQVAEARRLVRKALRGKVAKLQFLDDWTLRLASRFAKPFGWFTGWDLSRTLELVRPTYGLMKGIPTNVPAASTYWRKRTPPPADPNPDRDGCGLLWCSPVAPMEGGHALVICEIAQRTLLEFGFEPMISVTLLTERSLSCVISIAYDRSVLGEDKKAMECHHALHDRLMQEGYHSYRLGIQSMDGMQGETGYNRLLQAIKGVCDPNDILAPGRYCGKAIAKRSKVSTAPPAIHDVESLPAVTAAMCERVP